MSPTTKAPRVRAADLRRRREAQGLTQVEVADRFGVSERTYRRWETGGTIPRWVALHFNRGGE